MGKNDSRTDYSVVCPFYKWSDINKVCCEGFEKNTTIHLAFGSRLKKKEHMEKFCLNINKYKQCTICAMLNRKYGVKNG